MLGIPTYVLALIAATVAGLAAPVLVAAYHRFIVYVFRKTGVQLPDNATIDGAIGAVLKALLPELLKEAVARKIDPQALLAAIEAAVGKRATSAAAAASSSSAAVLQPFDPTKSGGGA